MSSNIKYFTTYGSINFLSNIFDNIGQEQSASLVSVEHSTELVMLIDIKYFINSKDI
jgi:hypothetical protein